MLGEGEGAELVGYAGIEIRDAEGRSVDEPIRERFPRVARNVPEGEKDTA